MLLMARRFLSSNLRNKRLIHLIFCNMEKKIYIEPKTKMTVVQLSGMLALSMIDDGKMANKGGEVLSREDNAWDIWGDEEDDAE